MRILSLDPGLTTGVAIYVDGELESSMTVTFKGIYRGGFLNILVSLAKPDVVLIEDVPQQMAHREVAELHAFLMRWFQVAAYDVRSVKPAQWKKLVKRVEIPGQHARDAATMALWWLQSAGQKEFALDKYHLK